MIKRTALFIFLFMTVAFLVDAPNVLAQSADNKGIPRDQFQRESTAAQQGDTKSDREMTRTGRAADNTGINRRDASQQELTAGQQGETKSDREITQKIRRGVLDKSLSTNANNVKIITVGGVVTLKGPVNSEAEKSAIEQVAVGIVDKSKIKNEIEIAR